MATSQPSVQVSNQGPRNQGPRNQGPRNQGPRNETIGPSDPPPATGVAAPPRTPPAAAPDRVLHMIGHAHLDPVWLWPWQEGYAEARATFRSAIERMSEYDDFVFTADQVVLLQWVEESDPELFAEIQRRVAEGRWQVVGGWWVEPDCNLPSGESLVRQGLYGQRYLAERLGLTATVGLNADPFGHAATLPAILRGQGMDSYVFLRPGPSELELPATLFWWEAPDGSRVLAYRIPYEYGSPPADVSGQTERSLGQLDRSMPAAMVFYGVGNHGGGPTRANLESIRRYDRMGTFGRLLLSSPRRYFDEVARRLGPDGMAELPVWRGELQHHAPGCYSAHSGVKAWQRRAQSALLAAERWAAVGEARLGLTAPRTELDRAWKQVLFNQFHDVLPGTAIESAYEDARDQLGEAVAIAKRVTTRVHNVLARQVAIPAEDVRTQPVLVFNPHPWPVRPVVELQYQGTPAGVHVVDACGDAVPHQRIQPVATVDETSRGALAFEADVPGLGYRLYRLRPGPAPNRPVDELVATDTVLENAQLRAEIDPGTGWLVSLLDKRTGRDVVRGAPGPHTQVSPDPSDTWGHRVVCYACPGESMTTTRVRLREGGPVRATVRVERAWGRSVLVEEISLGRRSDQLEVRVELDWREPTHLLKLRFPTALAQPRATFEIPFGTLQRPVNATEEPAQTWVDLSGTLADGARAGLAAVVTPKHGVDASPEPSPSIGITAVRSPVYAWHDPRLLHPDGVYSYQDQGRQEFRYLLVPHAGDWRAAGLARRSAELEMRVRAMLETFHQGSLAPTAGFAHDGGGPVLITAVKPAYDGIGLVVRAVETTGVPTEVDLDLPLVGRRIRAEFGPHEIRTFLLPHDPDAEVVEVDLVERALAR